MRPTRVAEPFHLRVRVHGSGIKLRMTSLEQAAPRLHEAEPHISNLNPPSRIEIPPTSTMIPSPTPEPYIFPLPQYGFGADIDYKTLVSSNPFLYRVYTPKERSPFADPTDPWFVAGKFDEVYARTPATITSAVAVDPLESSYEDVAAYMEWTTRPKSIFVSASFNFAWSIWEAVRRYHHGMKKDVEIAIIDAAALLGRAATGVELLKKCSPEERNSQHSKWYRFSQESQSVLIHGFVPGYAVLASVPLPAILERLPSYYLRSKTLPTPGKPLDHLGWNYADKKLNYRQFCQEISNRFFAQSQEMRFRDATGGSLRLALTLLRPWFHRMITQDFRYATRGLRDLAIIIAHWGGQWWAKEHSELNRILDTMANTLGEELLQRFKKEDQEIHRLQDSVATLEKVIRSHETKRLTTRSNNSTVRREYCSTPTTPEHSPRVRPRRTLSMSMSMPSRDAANVHSPITPPDSPDFSTIFSRNIESEFLPSTIAFQPFTPPIEWPSLPTPPRQLSVSTRSLSSSGTPPALRSMLSPVAEVPTPVDPAPSASLVEEPESIERPQTPTTPRRARFQHPSIPYLPSPVATPPAVLDSLQRDGLRARTISDLSKGRTRSLTLDIPGSVPRQLVFPPSPVENDAQTAMWTARAETPAGLAPATPPPEKDGMGERKENKEHGADSGFTRLPLSKGMERTASSTLGSPILLSAKELVGEEEDVTKELPPLPPSPALSWGSSSTLPPSQTREGSPEPRVRDSFLSDTTRIGSDSPILKAVAELEKSKSLDSTSSWTSAPRRVSTTIGLADEEAVDENASVRVDQSEVEAESAPTTPLSDYLPTPTDEEPKRGPILQYRLPKPPTGIFGSHSHLDAGVGYGSDDDFEGVFGRRAAGRQQKRSGFAETGAFMVTGFLVGAFVTLFLVSTQRRAVLYLT